MTDLPGVTDRGSAFIVVMNLPRDKQEAGNSCFALASGNPEAVFWVESSRLRKLSLKIRRPPKDGQSTNPI
ncbi:hypothetical protein JCM30471_25180 [Desulfuromonas carbonis]